MLSLVMALLSSAESAPRAYRLKAGNADPSEVQHDRGHPRKGDRRFLRRELNASAKLGDGRVSGADMKVRGIFP
jgi:hypothetical protein